MSVENFETVEEVHPLGTINVCTESGLTGLELHL